MSRRTASGWGLGSAAFLLLAVVSVPGCGSCSDAWFDTARLEVHNGPDSTLAIERVEMWAIYSGAYGFDVEILPGEAATFEVDADDYEVEVHWPDGHVDRWPDVHLYEGERTVIVAER